MAPASDARMMVRQRRFRPERPRSAPLPELLHVLMLPHLERADRIGEFWGYPESRIRRTLDRLRGGRTLRAGMGLVSTSLTYPSYRSRLMYGPGACVTIQIAIRAPAALPAPLAWQEGVILAWTPARLGSTNPVSRVAHSRPGGNLGHRRASRTASVGRVLPPYRRTDRPGWIGRRGD